MVSQEELRMAAQRFNPPREQIADFCRRHHIVRFSLFGSVLRDDFRPHSDVDVLVEFAPGHTPGLEIVDIEEELSHLLGGRRVDLVNPKYLNRRLKDRVVSGAEVLYAAG
jgi:predicted nucleotidyltransferase